MRFKTGASIVLFWSCLLPSSVAVNATPDGAADNGRRLAYHLRTSVVSAAGCSGTSSTRRQVGSLGQSTPIGIGNDPGRTLYAGFWGIFLRHVLLSDAPPPAPLADRLEPNYPNPFNPATRIDFSLSTEKLVDLSVFDLRGQRVRVLLREVRPPGPHHVIWDGRDDLGRRVATGAYFYRLATADYRSIEKMLLVK